MTHFKVATQSFLDMTQEQQEAVLDAQQYAKVVLTQEQIDREVDRHIKMRKAQEHFAALAEKLKLGVRA